MPFHKYAKSVEPVLVTRSTCRGSGIAQFVETSNAESPTPMYKKPTSTQGKIGTPSANVGI